PSEALPILIRQRQPASQSADAAGAPGVAVPWTHGRGPRGPGELGGDRPDPEGRHGAPGRLRRRGLARPPLRLRRDEPADGMAARGRPRAPRLAGTRGGPGPVLRRRAGPPARPLLRVAP